MAKKVQFNTSDLFNNQNESEMVNSNQDMIDAMEKARQEIQNEKKNASKPKTTKSSSSKSNTTKASKTLTNKEIIEQNEQANFKPEFMTGKHFIVNEMKAKVNEILPNMNIDLNNIIISDSLDSLEKHTNLDLVFNSKPTFQVPLPQSCYTVYVEALKYADIDAIKNSTMDEYHTTLKMFQIVHNRIQATTLGAISFDTFIECTSFFDLQNIFYGLHMQTFPGKTSFSFQCANCNHEFDLDIPNDSLFFVKDDKIFERFDEVARNSETVEEVMKGSLISKHQRVCLEQSKTIIDIRIPSLKNQLDILKNTPSNVIKEESNNLATLLFIKDVYLLNVPETLDKGKPVYYKITGQNEIINVLKMLSLNDSKQLSKAVDDWTNQYKMEYRIPSFNCPKCGKDLGTLTLDMENVLFRQMLSQ